MKQRWMSFENIMENKTSDLIRHIRPHFACCRLNPEYSQTVFSDRPERTSPENPELVSVCLGHGETGEERE